MKRLQNLRQTAREARDSGFTLVEIMVVVVIIGMLATLVATNIDVLFEDAETSTAQSECKTIHGQAAYFKRKNRRIPTLDDLFEKDERGRALIQSGGREDPWGTAYIIREDEYRNIEVISAGPDQIEDTEDDIVFPDRDEDA
ncbi:MAG: prepilin-type N-terminal cleavage/methylation domain-containing protein [Planctomycetota bacterium]